METHAVPQDITGFKFKLVGDMTVKQFGELAGGAIVAYIFFASNLHPFIKFPIAGFFALFGVALAFLPVEERPLDVWLINFFKAIYRPTYYVWRRQGSLPPPVNAASAMAMTPATATPPTALPNIRPSLPSQPALSLTPMTTMHTPIPKKVPDDVPKPIMEEKPLEQATIAVSTSPVPPPPPPVAPTAETQPPQPILSIDGLEKLRQQKATEATQPKPAVSTPSSTSIPVKSGEPQVLTIDHLEKMRKSVIAEKEEQSASNVTRGEAEMQELIEQNKALLMKIDEIRNELVKYGQLPPEAQAKLDDLNAQKAKLNEKILTLRNQVIDERVSPIVNPVYREPIRKAPQVRVVSKVAPTPATITLTELPNVINGTVTDASGKPLENVIIIVKDQAGNSIRALKTNKVGQFIGSTPLESGTYQLELEKQNYQFDLLELNLSGEVMKPMQVVAKGEAPAPEGAKV